MSWGVDFMAFLASVGALSLAENAAMYSLKKYETKPSNNIKFYILGALIYGVAVPYLLLRSLKYEGLGTVNLAWNLISTFSAYAIGIYFFGEKVTHLKALGVMVALTGLGMVLLGDEVNESK